MTTGVIISIGIILAVIWIIIDWRKNRIK